MEFSRFPRFLTLGVALACSVGLSLLAQDTGHRGRKYKSPPPTSRIQVTVLRNEDGKPIQNAAVVFHLEGDKGNMELKTDEDGKASLDVLPTGSKILLQVLAKGYQTYGKDYSVDQPEIAVEVKLKRPAHQYSIYENHPEAGSQGDGAGKEGPAGTDKNDSPKKDQPADQSGSDKPASNRPQPQR